MELLILLSATSFPFDFHASRPRIVGKMSISASNSGDDVHKVPILKSSNFFSKISVSAKNIFFPDDPLRHFKDQKLSRKCILGIQYVFPILSWMWNYTLTDLRADLLAGLTLASLSIPQGIAYARLLNVPPIVGLYCVFVPPLIFAIFTTSKELVIGPVAIASVVMGGMLRSEIDPKENPKEHLYLLFTSTFFSGIIMAGLGALRFGFLLDFLSHAGVLGFVCGAAILSCLLQFKEMLGLHHFATKLDSISMLRSIFRDTQDWNWVPITFSICFVTYILTTKFFANRGKKIMFWVSTLAPLTGIVISTLCVWLTHADSHLRIVGHQPKGVNPPSLHKLIFHGPLVLSALKIGAMGALVALMEAIAVGRTYAFLKGYHLDGNKEMIAIGLANVFGSFSSCFITTGGLCRTALNAAVGGRTSVCNIVLAICVLFTLLFLIPLFYYTPSAILASLIFATLIGIIDLRKAYSLWKVDKFDFVAFLGAFLGVLFISVPMGIAIAVIISMLRILLHTTRPHISLLGRMPKSGIYCNIEHYSDAIQVPRILSLRIDGAIYFLNANYIQVPRILSLRIDGAIYFLNANYIREKVTRYVEDIESKYQFMILDFSPVTAIDTSGIHALEQIYGNLKCYGVKLFIANPSKDVLEKLLVSSFVRLLGDGTIYQTVEHASQACMKLMAQDEESRGNFVVEDKIPSQEYLDLIVQQGEE